MAVKSFLSIDKQDYPIIGGKASKLAQYYKKGFPVPEGFVVFPDEIGEGGLREEAKPKVLSLVSALRESSPAARFAVRSSAINEDTLSDSYAGVYESVLGLSTEYEILSAIEDVAKSGRSSRAKAYMSSRKPSEPEGGIAVIVMIYIQADMAGVLFTADPITGSHAIMPGNIVFGVADKLLSGSEDGLGFQFSYPKGKYTGPDEFSKLSKKLFKMALAISKAEGFPQDIEFAAKGDNVYLIQSRPITSLVTEKLDTYEINDSLDGDMLWTSTNVGEATPDVFTPLTFSVHRLLDKSSPSVPGFYLVSGNILGRVYTNISMQLSFSAMAKIGYQSALLEARQHYGDLPDDMPIYPFKWWEYIRASSKLSRDRLRVGAKASSKLKESLEAIPAEAQSIEAGIKDASDREGLLKIWDGKLWPLAAKANNILRFAFDREIYHFINLKPKLVKILGESDANLLLSRQGGEGALASLGPLVGLSDIIAGKMTREEYAGKYGHRGAHEFELSIADISESPSLLEESLEEVKKGSFDIEQLFESQKERYSEAVQRLEQNHPGKAKNIMKMVSLASKGSQKREMIRMEWTRAYRLIRPFCLKAGEILGLDEDIFFYYIQEIAEMLKTGENKASKFIPERKRSYERYLSLPEPPACIRGPYRPGQASQPAEEATSQTVLSGIGGATGVVTAKVRVLRSLEEAGSLEMGEILVAPTTNIGWSSVFPRSAAIVTDIGAPLSHATIIARELGIPAVVGCKVATKLLRDGDIVTVDGGAGLVRLNLEESASPA